jgi:hypothetical protein
MSTLFDVLDELPPDVVEDLDPSVIEQLEGLDRIPDSLKDQIPDAVLDRIPDQFLDFASSNPLFTAVLVIVGIVAGIGFFWGVTRSAFKAAFFFGVVAVGAWFLFFST